MLANRRGRTRGTLTILASFVIALVLMAIPLPNWALPFRPDWAGLVLVYWCLALPQRVAVGSGWLVGLVLDVMYGGLLGQHALAKSVVAFLAVTFHRRVRMFPVWQQAATVFLFLLIDQGLVIWVEGAVGEYSGRLANWIPSVTSMLIWPWVFIIMRDVRRRARLA